MAATHAHFVRIDEPLDKALRRHADAAQLPLSDVWRVALNEYLAKRGVRVANGTKK